MVHNEGENISRIRDQNGKGKPMSVIQRGLRSSARSKAVIAKMRPASGGEEVSAVRMKPSALSLGRALPRASSGSGMVQAALALTDDQQTAAEHLAEIFAAAEFETWARAGFGLEEAACDPLHPSPEALIARAAYRSAMRAVPLLLSPIIVHVCCLGLPLARWADEKQLPLAQAEAGLRVGLNHLVRHFQSVALA